MDIDDFVGDYDDGDCGLTNCLLDDNGQRNPLDDAGFDDSDEYNDGLDVEEEFEDIMRSEKGSDDILQQAFARSINNVLKSILDDDDVTF